MLKFAKKNNTYKAKNHNLKVSARVFLHDQEGWLAEIRDADSMSLLKRFTHGFPTAKSARLECAYWVKKNLKLFNKDEGLRA
jgi:hypothetical protein